MHKQSSNNAVKDVCTELEKAVQRRRGKTVGEWLRKRKKNIQSDKKMTKGEG